MLTAGCEGVDGLAVDQMKLHLVAEHPRGVFFLVRVGPDALGIVCLGRSDDAVAQLLDIV